MKVNETVTEIVGLIAARNALLWLTSREETRAERIIIQAATKARYRVLYWDVATGLSNETGEVINPAARDPMEMIRLIALRPDDGSPEYVRTIYVLRDFHAWIDGAPTIVRAVKSAARSIQEWPVDYARAMIVLSPKNEIPAEWSECKALELPLPDRAEMRTVLVDMLDARFADDKARHVAALDPSKYDIAVDAVVGLTAEEAASCFAKSLVTRKGKVDIAAVSSEKKRVIARDGLLEWYDPDPRGFDGLGGLDILKATAMMLRTALDPKARDYGLDVPGGLFLAGVPGCGKSLCAKTLAAAWGVPLLRLDLGAQQSKYVGESQQNIRKAFALAETIGRCVLWIDEIEKAMAGSTGTQGDGGVSADQLGTFLTWMQEKRERGSEVFVIATANDISGLPPEMLRRGRFDDIFFVDVPTFAERIDILRVTLKKYKRDSERFDLKALAQATADFTGSEVASIVGDAMRYAFSQDGREPTTADMLDAAAKVVPLTATAKEKIAALREWAKTRARHASSRDIDKPRAQGRRDLDMVE